MSELKLYVWSDPYAVKYGTSMLISIARSEDEARAQAAGAPAYKYSEFPDGTRSGVKLGAPTRIIDLPCAEWHEWSE